MTSNVAPRSIAFSSPKGGVGTTVMAAAFAVTVAQAGHTVVLVDDGSGDAFAACGLSATGKADVLPGLTVVSSAAAVDAAAWVVYDNPARTGELPALERHVLVVEATYLALRRAVAAKESGTMSFDSMAVRTADGFCLGVRDVEAALRLPVAAIVESDTRVGRSVDAGLLPARMPHSLSRAAREILATVH